MSFTIYAMSEIHFGTNGTKTIGMSQEPPPSPDGQLSSSNRGLTRQSSLVVTRRVPPKPRCRNHTAQPPFPWYYTLAVDGA